MSCPECARRLRAMEAMEVDIANFEADLKVKRREIGALKRHIKTLENGVIPEEKVQAIFDLWVQKHKKNPSRTKLGEARDKKIRAALKLFEFEQVQWAIEGAVLNAWVDPESGTRYDDLVTILKSEATIQRHIEAYERQLGIHLVTDAEVREADRLIAERHRRGVEDGSIDTQAALERMGAA